MNNDKIISEEKLKEEVKKIRFGCGKELDEETYCGQDFWV